MPRFLVHRMFPSGLAIAADEAGAETWRAYVSEDWVTTACVDDGAWPDAIRAAAARNGLAVHTSGFSVLDPNS